MAIFSLTIYTTNMQRQIQRLVKGQKITHVAIKANTKASQKKSLTKSWGLTSLPCCSSNTNHNNDDNNLISNKQQKKKINH